MYMYMTLYMYCLCILWPMDTEEETPHSFYYIYTFVVVTKSPQCLWTLVVTSMLVFTNGSLCLTQSIHANLEIHTLDFPGCPIYFPGEHKLCQKSAERKQEFCREIHRKKQVIPLQFHGELGESVVNLRVLIDQKLLILPFLGRN